VRMVCLGCEGTGIGAGMRARFGELMNRCDRCDGHGIITDEPGQPDFVAIFPVSERYLVHLRIPRPKGGTVPIDVNWSPRVPPARGRRALTYIEKEAYDRGRTAALAAFMAQMGGGDWKVVEAGERA
jgi:hypothetical protein